MCLGLRVDLIMNSEIILMFQHYRFLRLSFQPAFDNLTTGEKLLENPYRTIHTMRLCFLRFRLQLWWIYAENIIALNYVESSSEITRGWVLCVTGSWSSGQSDKLFQVYFPWFLAGKCQSITVLLFLIAYFVHYWSTPNTFLEAYVMLRQSSSTLHESFCVISY